MRKNRFQCRRLALKTRGLYAVAANERHFRVGLSVFCAGNGNTAAQKNRLLPQGKSAPAISRLERNLEVLQRSGRHNFGKVNGDARGPCALKIGFAHPRRRTAVGLMGHGAPMNKSHYLLIGVAFAFDLPHRRSLRKQHSGHLDPVPETPWLPRPEGFPLSLKKLGPNKPHNRPPVNLLQIPFQPPSSAAYRSPRGPLSVSSTGRTKRPSRSSLSALLACGFGARRTSRFLAPRASYQLPTVQRRRLGNLGAFSSTPVGNMIYRRGRAFDHEGRRPEVALSAPLDTDIKKFGSRLTAGSIRQFTPPALLSTTFRQRA